MSQALVLALDIGTSSARAALFTQRATIITASLHQQHYQARTDANGAFEINPRVLLRAVAGCIDGVLAWHLANAANRTIEVVGADCFWHSLIGTTTTGKPTTAIMTWADTRGAHAARQLSESIDGPDYHARTGCMLHASFWPAKHQFLKQQMRGEYRQTAFWMSPAEWITWQFTGIRQCAHGMATGTGLYDPCKLSWDHALLEQLQIPIETLSPLSDALIEPSHKLATRWPALRNVPWVAAIGDGIASNLGCGATSAPYAAINYGTSAAVRIVKRGSKANAPYGMFAYRIDQQRYLLGGAISNAGNLYQWAQTHLRIPTDPIQFEKQLARQTSRAHGLTVLPFWNGERAPYWHDDLNGSIVGLRQSTTALDIAAALREATLHRLALIAAKLPARGRREAVVAGGLPPSSLQLMADVTGLKVRAAGVREASVRGAAVFALERLGQSQIPPPRWGKLITPNRERQAYFRSERRRHEALERLLR